MSNPATITDVAKAAGVAKSTVSCVMNGQAEKYRIGHDTQVRILTIARQLDYHPNPVAREIALGHGAAPLLGLSTEKAPISNVEPKKPWIGLIISASSSTESMNLIPSLVQVLTAAGYQLVIDAITAEPSSARELVTPFLRDGISGIICCPTVYSDLSAMVASQCPIIVLWQGAGKAIIKTVSSGQSAVGSEESSRGSGQLAVSSPRSETTGNSATINLTTQQQEPGKTETQSQAPKTVFNVVAAVSGGTGSVTAHPVSPPPVTTIPVSKPEPISHGTPKPMVTPEPPPVQEPTPPVSVPVVEPPPPANPAPTPIVMPEPEITVELTPPVYDPVPAPADGTEAVPPVDNSLDDEDRPAVSLPNRPIRSTEPAIIEPIPVAPPTPVFEPPPEIATPEAQLPPLQMQEPTPPVSAPVVAPPPPEDPTPIPVIAPEPEIVVEPPTPASEPEPAPADGTGVVPSADNSLEGEACPEPSRRVGPSRSTEPANISPIPVVPLTPVFEPPPEITRPEGPVPPPQMQEPEPPVSVPMVEPPPAVIPIPIPVAMPMPEIAAEPPPAVIIPVTTVPPPQAPEPVITIAPEPVPVIVAEPETLPPPVIAAPPPAPTPPPPAIIPAPPPEPITPDISDAPANAETNETTPDTGGNQVPDAVETPTEIEEISPETASGRA